MRPAPFIGSRKEHAVSDWKLEVYYRDNDDGTEVVDFVQWGPFVDRKAYAELGVGYSFFDTELEAAKAFLEEVRENPDARYHRTDYEDAVLVLQQEGLRNDVTRPDETA